MPVRISMIAILLFATLYVSGLGLAQTQPGVREYVRNDYKIAISFPTDWELLPAPRNEVWFAFGNLRGATASCFVRTSVVPNLRLVKPDDFFAQTDEKAFVKLGSMNQPDIRVHLYDFSYLGGRKARRIIYSGTDDGLKIGNLMHQTLDSDRIVTVTCFVELQNFQLVFKELSAIAGSFRFLR